VNGWRAVGLGDIFTIARGGSPRPIDEFITDDPNGVNWIMIGDAAAGSKYIRSTRKRIRREGVSRSREVKPGDFLLTNSMSFGRPYILATAGCIHDGWLVLSPRTKHVDQDYFYHLLGSPIVYAAFERLAAGAVVKNLNSELVRGVRVPLPPLSEQRRIADILDKADAIRRKRKEAIALPADLLRSAFLEMFGDPVTNPKGWPLHSVSDLCENKQYGTAEKANKNREGAPVLRMNNLTYSGAIDLAELKWVPLSDAERAKLDLRDGDVLFNRVNSRELVGKTAVWHHGNGYTFAGYLIRLRMKREVLGDYVAAAMNMPSMKRVLMRIAKPSINMANISGTDLSRVKIPLPPLTEQRKYRQVCRHVCGWRAHLEEHAHATSALFDSLVQRAFRGELAAVGHTPPRRLSFVDEQVDA
jgi:type I restriction enzyme S subunit